MLLVPAARNWAWLAILLDYGTLAFIVASPRLFRDFWNTSSFNMLYGYSGQLENKSVQLRLFHQGIFTVRINIQRPAGQCGLVSTGTIGSWRIENEKLKLEIHGGDCAEFSISKILDSEFLHQEKGFMRFEKEVDTSLSGIKLALKSKTPLAST